MKVKRITVALTAKVPMQDYGSIDISATFEAEINDGDDPVACGKLLSQMAREELTDSVMPLIQNRLDFAAYLMRHWPVAESSDKWSSFLESDTIQPLMRSGIMPVSVIKEAIEAMRGESNAD